MEAKWCNTLSDRDQAAYRDINCFTPESNFQFLSLTLQQHVFDSMFQLESLTNIKFTRNLLLDPLKFL